MSSSQKINCLSTVEHTVKLNFCKMSKSNNLNILKNDIECAEQVEKDNHGVSNSINSRKIELNFVFVTFISITATQINNGRKSRENYAFYVQNALY